MERDLELADKQREIERLSAAIVGAENARDAAVDLLKGARHEIEEIRAHLVTWKRVTRLIFNQAVRRHLDAIALANSLPRNQAPAPRPWWKRVWFK